MTYNPPNDDERVHLGIVVDTLVSTATSTEVEIRHLLRDLANAADHDRAPTVLERLHVYAEDLELDLPAPDWWLDLEDD